jgi:hypothetical protein
MSSTISLLVGDGVQGDVAVRAGGSTGAKSDTQNLDKPATGFHANVAGTVAIKMSTRSDAPTLSFVVVAGGSYPYRVARVMSTGTSLTNAELVLLYGPSST